ncbi:glycosyltransferase, partial [Priestia megaterium]|nr:glycosyltransferase [Priestia megaterium]
MRVVISIVVRIYFDVEVGNECYYRLLSVMHKNHINYEFIFVNDGST